MTERTRVVMRPVTEYWEPCYRCRGDGKHRPITGHQTDHAPSGLTVAHYVVYGPPSDTIPCERCKGTGGQWYARTDA